MVGTTLRFGGGVWPVEAAGDAGAIRCPDGGVGELAVKVTLQKGRVVKRPPLVLVLSGKALLELRFSMEWYTGLFTSAEG